MSDECSSDVASCLVYGTIMGPIFQVCYLKFNLSYHLLFQCSIAHPPVPYLSIKDTSNDSHFLYSTQGMSLDPLTSLYNDLMARLHSMEYQASDEAQDKMSVLFFIQTIYNIQNQFIPNIRGKRSRDTALDHWAMSLNAPMLR